MACDDQPRNGSAEPATDDVPTAGLLNLNKPAGMTSRAVVDQVERVARTRRVGHAGTLDPLATGVLVVCVGWATRLVSCVQELRKSYRAEFLLGRTSDTDDITGRVEELADGPRPALADILAVLPTFVGRISQVPPSHSAVHVAGKRAYEMARAGQRVELPARDVEVYRAELKDYEYPRLELDIDCGSGTYIRSIGRDLGRLLGCGAVMSRLERRSIGEFHVESAIAPDQLDRESWRAHLLPPVAAVRHLPRYVCPREQRDPLASGRVLPVAPGKIENIGDAATGAMVAIVDSAGNLLALAEYGADQMALQPRQVFVGAR